jgi:hypothetical protein
MTTLKQNLLTDIIEFKHNALNLALHACGNLSSTIVKAFANSTIPGTLIIIPCCYAKFRENYEWLSPEYKSLGLKLSSTILRSILTQPKGDHDKQIKTYIFKRHTRIIKILICLIANKYISVPDSIMHCNFTNVNNYLQHITQLVQYFGIPYNDNLQEQIDSLMPQAIDMINKIEMIESQFVGRYRRFYELMILEDHVLYLKSKGLKTFMFPYTHVSITPRNICILARRD